MAKKELRSTIRQRKRAAGTQHDNKEHGDELFHGERPSFKI